MGLKRMHVLVAAVQVPFTRGGAEILTDSLVRELGRRNCSVDVVQIPFSAASGENLVKQIELWRMMDLSEFNGHKVDLVIATKFPSYVVRHPCKVVWLVHQHRQLYDLYGSRFGETETAIEDEALRQYVVRADRDSLSESRAIYSISPNVRDRLRRYLQLDSGVLLPPLPLGDRYRLGRTDGYILSVGRICSIKRVDMIVKALPMITDRLSLKIVGAADESCIMEYLHNEIEKHHLWHRVEFLGRVDDTKLLDLYSNCFAVYYAPYDEDYGFVTLEGLSSGKPIISATDSGGVLEFLRHEYNGLVAEPSEAGVAKEINRLYSDKSLYERLSSNAGDSFTVDTWDRVVDKLAFGVMKNASAIQPGN